MWSEKMWNWWAHRVRVIPPAYYKFSRAQIKGDKPGNVCQILFVVYNDGKIQLQRQLILHTCHPFFRPTLFSFNLATFFCNFRFTLSTFNVLLINHFSILFPPLVSSVKDKNFQCNSVFYQVVLKNVIRVLQCIWASSILWETVLKRILFKLY